MGAAVPFLRAPVPVLEVAVGLMALGGLVSLLNWLTLLQTWRTGRFCSPVPLLGTLSLAAGMLLYPATRPYAWVAVPADYGTLTLLFALPYLAGELWSTSRFNLLEEYAGTRGARTVRLRLFRRGVFTLEQRIRRQPGECGLLRLGTIGTWQRDGGRLLLRMGEQSAVFEAPPARAETLRQTAGFPGYEESAELSLGGIDLLLEYRRARP